MKAVVVSVLFGVLLLGAGATIIATSARRPDTLENCLKRDFSARGIASDFKADTGEFFGASPRGRYEGKFNGGRVRVVYKQVDEWNWELVTLEQDQ